ncbi:MAG: hypothetical protein IMW89_20600, partial [Ktedonobacteraceae bacterium]|nr:hypothetical protein [Ktedonobacteraceae bacterium]
MSPTEPLPAASTWDTARTGAAAPFFPVIDDVTFKQAAEAREQEARRPPSLTTGIGCIISTISLCAAMLG